MLTTYLVIFHQNLATIADVDALGGWRTREFASIEAVIRLVAIVVSDYSIDTCGTLVCEITGLSGFVDACVGMVYMV